jgi:imidazolonepropionase-like amidohydrolase
MIKAVQDGFVSGSSPQDKMINLKAQTVMPGWIDMHVHVEEETSPTHYADEFTLNDADIAYNAIGYVKVP